MYLEILLYVILVSDDNDVHDQIDVPEVPRTIVDLASTRLAPQAGLDDPQMGVHEAHVDREAVVVVCVRRDDLRRGHPPDLVRAEEGELDRLDSLRHPTHGRHHRMSSSCSRMTTPNERSSSRRSLNAYDVWTG